MPVVSGCTEVCWTPVYCKHGRTMTPIGRDPGMSGSVLCECYQYDSQNQRHLWSVHDCSRIYNDPEGWAAHEATCDQCRGDES